jgi:hypothetical protein
MKDWPQRAHGLDATCAVISRAVWIVARHWNPQAMISGSLRLAMLKTGRSQLRHRFADRQKDDGWSRAPSMSFRHPAQTRKPR